VNFPGTFFSLTSFPERYQEVKRQAVASWIFGDLDAKYQLPVSVDK
jgi:hypothetical protein